MLALLFAAPPVFASEITGTLTAGSGSTVGGTVVALPTASPAPGTYSTAQSVSLTSAGASSIRYTVDGSAPTCAGGGLLYSAPIVVSSSLTINALSCYASGASSSVGAYTYLISGSTLSGTVATSSGGSLSGTVVAPSSGGGGSGGGGGSSSSGSGGGSSGGISSSGSGSAIPPTGQVLGSSTAVPTVPNTGAGGEAPAAMLALMLSAFIALAGFGFLRRYGLT